MLVLGGSSPTLAQTRFEYRRQIARLIQDYRWLDALELAEQGIERYPQDHQLMIAAAALMLQAGQAARGERLVEDAVSSDVKDPELLGIMAELKLSRGRPMEAEHLMKEALRYAPENAHLHHRLSRLLFARGDGVGALEHAEKSVELDGGRNAYRRFYASLLEQTGRIDEAYAQLRMARHHSPGDAKLLLRLSDTVRRDGRSGSALEYLEMAAGVDPENPLYQEQLSELYDELGAPEQAVRARARAKRLQKAFQAYAEAVGLVSNGREAEAVERLESVVEVNPEFTTGALLLADLYRKTGVSEAALEIYRKVLQREPSRTRVREEYAWVYVDKGDLATALEILEENGMENLNEVLLSGYRKELEEDWEGAMEDFKHVESQYPLHPELLQQISLCLNSMGRSEEALAYLNKARTVEPENQEIDETARLVRFEYGLRLEKQGQWEEARGLFAGLRKEDAERADYYFHEAYCRQQLWEYEPAVDLYRKGLRLEPQVAWARINLATCFYALSLYDEAAQQWEYLVSESNTPQYVYHLGLARLRQWKLDEGWKLIDRAAELGFEPARKVRRLGRKY